MFQRKWYIVERTAIFFKTSLQESIAVTEATLSTCQQDVSLAVETIVESYNQGGKILLCGNGGSAADCQHLATELMIRLNHNISRPALGAISLCTDSSNMTAGGNDIGFENVFARNVEGLGKKGDVLIGISTSGNSQNVLRAIIKAKEIGLKTLSLLGGTGGLLKDNSDISVVVPSDNVQRIQEMHIKIGHVICESVEQELYGD